MRIVFKKIPKLALYFYVFGFITIAVALYLYFSVSTIISTVQNQQLFIGGAVIVAIGSVINNLAQFKK